MKIYFHRRKVNLKEIDIYKIREIFCGRKMRKKLVESIRGNFRSTKIFNRNQREGAKRNC